MADTSRRLGAQGHARAIHRLSADLYEKSRATTDKAERVKFLEQIRLIWPEYKDISLQLKELSAP